MMRMERRLRRQPQGPVAARTDRKQLVVMVLRRRSVPASNVALRCAGSDVC